MKRVDPRQLEVASLTDVGRLRTANEDAFGSRMADSGARLLVVADGMGGHAGGAVASRLAVEAVEAVFERSDAPPEELVRQALEEANHRVHATARADPRLAGMGTTGVLLLFPAEGGAFVAHVGDSRAYRLRRGALEPLTADHSVVAELERRGLLTAEQARAHPRRNEVLRSIGVEPQVLVDVAPVDVQSGDQFLLCSDGLNGVVGDTEIAALLQAHAPEEAARRLVAAANARGGPDNVTVQIARVPARVAVGDRERVSARRRARATGLLGLAALLAVALATQRSCAGAEPDPPPPPQGASR